jgi:photosystem II stability/assembly factor-like uncharacterized protein
MHHKTHNRQQQVQPLRGILKSASRLHGTSKNYLSTLLSLALILLAATLTVQAQWDIEDSHTTASLRGIHNVGGGVAWASGTHGTVLRTEDGGYLWQTCTIPPGAEKLDFRGIQAFDENTAIVMSSGPGDQSRLYKTTDGCQTWKLLFTNPDKEGFWDGLVANKAGGIVIGDPADGRFAIFSSLNNGHQNWFRFEHPERAPTIKIPAPHSNKEALFAASNSILSGDGWSSILFVTGGADGSYLYGTKWHSWPADYNFATFATETIPLAKGASAGAFSFATSTGCNTNKKGDCSFVVVGGDYQKPDQYEGTAAYASIKMAGDTPDQLKKSQTPPHGYRSSVAYDPIQKLWITVGPNGTDISRDDGKNWQPLKPSGYDPADADKNWNALSLPFVVGPSGRIGRLRTITIPSK